MQEIKAGIYQHNLNEATTIFVVPNDQAETITLRYIFDRGSVDDPVGNIGITNLVQRLSQKKTASHNSHYQLMRALEEQGVSLGAATHKETHGFKIGLTEEEALPKALEIFNEVVWQPRFDEELLEKEKDLIRQDWAQIKDNPRDWVSIITVKKLWQGSPYAYPPLGDIDAIDKTTIEDLTDHHQRIRQKSNLYIGVAGKLRPDKIEDTFKVFSAPSQRAGESGKDVKYLQGAGHALPKPFDGVRFAVEQREIQQANLWIAFPTIGITNDKYYSTDLLSWVTGKGFLSRLFNTIRTQNSLAYYYYGNYQPLKDIGAFVIFGGVPADKLEKVFAETWKQVQDVQSGGLKDWERQRGFNYYTSNKARSLEQSDKLLSFVLSQYLNRGEILTFEEWKERLSYVNLDDLKEAACEILQPQKATVGVVGPVTESDTRTAWQQTTA